MDAIDYDKLQKSLKHLEVQYVNWQRSKHRPELTEVDREGIAESVIHRFETCYESLWKVLKRYLDEEVGLAETPNSPKPLLKLAGQSDLLPTSVDQWLLYADARTSTAHDYSGDKAEECLALIGDFIRDAIDLFTTMSKEPLELNRNIDVTAQQRRQLLDILRLYIPGVEVWAYGSRVRWKARPIQT